MDEQSLAKVWSEAPEIDRKAILAGIRGHIRHSTERRESYKKEHPEDSQDPKILGALDSRQKTAEVALMILGETIE